MAALARLGRLLVGLGQPALPLAARGRRDRLDRLVVLLHRARQPPRAARRASATPSAASAARRGRSTAAASTGSRSSASRRRRSPSRSTGSSGRRTRRGSRDSRCSSSSTSSHPSTFLIDTRSPTSTSWEAIAIAVGGCSLAWLVYDGLCRAARRRRAGARGRRLRVRRACRVGARASSSRRAPPTSRSARCSGR